MLFSLFKHYLEIYITDTALKVSQSLYCFITSVSHGVENYFPRLWGMGIIWCYFLWIKFQSETIHPVLNVSKTLSELSNTGIKVPGVKCQVYLGVIGIKMMGNIESGNYMAEGVSVKSNLKGGLPVQNLWGPHKGVRRHPRSYYTI